jgi:hypothetical protein
MAPRPDTAPGERGNFKDIAIEWLAKCDRKGLAEITLAKIRWLLEMADPIIGARRSQ